MGTYKEGMAIYGVYGVMLAVALEGRPQPVVHNQQAGSAVPWQPVQNQAPGTLNVGLGVQYTS